MKIEFLSGLVSCFLLLSSALSFSQELCNGILGDNIFEDGNFGAGQENIPFLDPGVAPGYIYTRNVPPPDGSYTVTNDMRRWSGNYGTWISIPDHSSDSDGYMMVVNASYQPGVFYEENITGLCSSTLYEFSADIINIVSRYTTGHTLPEIDFLIDDEVKYSTGKIPQDEAWKKYGFTFMLPTGKTSVKLTLINRAPGGTGNDLALDNISFQPCGPEGVIGAEHGYPLFLCEGDPTPFPLRADVDTGQNVILWQRLHEEGNPWTNIGGINQVELLHTDFTPGVYQYRFMAAGGVENLSNEKCRTVSDPLKLEVLPLHYPLIDTFCLGSAYLFNGEAISIPGTYIDTLTSSAGCDSIVTLDLIEVENIPLSASWNTSDPSCFDFSDGEIVLESIEGGYPPYTFTLNESVVNHSGGFDGLTGNIYRIYYEDRFGCNNRAEMVLNNPGEFIISLPGDTTLNLGEKLDIQAIGNQRIQSILWAPSQGIECEDCASTGLLAINSVTIQALAENAEGCEARDSFILTVDKDNIALAFPNAFTPNGDGENDYFNVVARPNLIESVEDFRVFDKWGNILFHTGNTPPDNGSSGWTGESGGHLLPSDVYIFKCDLRLIDGSVYSYSGDVLLIR